VSIVFDNVAPAVLAEPPGADPDTPVAIAETPDGFIAPATIGDGYQLLGRYQHPNGEVQLYYSDGLFTMSLFEQRGRVDWDSLPPGRQAKVAGVRTRAYGTAAGNVVVWAAPADHLVFTAVGDGPSGALNSVVAGISGASDGGDWIGDAARYVLGPFGWE
jgi:sigma-E factor negative regulatory protein RseB